MTIQSPRQDTIIAILGGAGWAHMFVRPVFDGKAGRWVSPTTAKGWQDLTAVHPATGVMLACELKGKANKPSPEQLDWLHRWHCVPSCAAVVWRSTTDAGLLLSWINDPGSLISGWGWAQPEQHRRVVTRQQVQTAGLWLHP